MVVFSVAAALSALAAAASLLRGGRDIRPTAVDEALPIGATRAAGHARREDNS